MTGRRSYGVLADPENMEQLRRAQWEGMRELNFAGKIFHPTAAMKVVDPVTHRVAFRRYDRANATDDAHVIEGGWDHDHCFMCDRRIGDGDRYYSNIGPEEVQLCESCYVVAREGSVDEPGR